MNQQVTSSQLSERLKAAWQSRKATVAKQKLEAFRLVHETGDNLPGLSIDVYAGDFLITLLDPIWSPLQIDLQKLLKELSNEIQPEHHPNFFWIENFPDQGTKCLVKEVVTKTIHEGDLAFEVHLGEGPHSGLFLDQRENRRLIRELAKDKTVLNLFCYTGSFTIAALKGSARQVHSVDLSKNYLQWLKRNLELNQISEKHSSLHPMDVFVFLNKEKDRQQRFDLLIVDPPTFSRTRDQSFSTERDLAKLLQSCAKLLAPKGKIFVSVNTKKLSPKDFQAQVKLAVQGTNLKILKQLPLPFDFRLSPEEKKNPYLKACLVG
jgi:23S rRNA (cytosine1962-C5)-methyltransferase